MKRILVLLLLGCVFSVYGKDKNPNIVYIICDDLGYGDVQYLNPQRGKIPTPSIDKLGTQGMTFTDAHSGSSVCTPTRYGILTGRYAWRSHLQRGVLGSGHEFEPLIAADRLTVPALLNQRGYRTACIGKWHLGFKFQDKEGNDLELYQGKQATPAPIGSLVPDGPVSKGFDYFVGFHHSASMETVIENNEVIDHMPVIKMLQFLGNHACDYITEKANRDEPFFLYLALNSPHSPVVPSKKWQGKSGIGAYGDFVMETDDVVGQVIEALKKNGISDNTLVIFTSDNGCSYAAAKGQRLETQFGHYPSAQYRGSKSDIWEGGHRMPFIVRWPGKVKANSVNNQLICHTNLMATCADIVGFEIPDSAGEDSFSILDMMQNQKAESPYESVIHHSLEGKFSIRKNKWKLELCPGSGGWTDPNDNKARQMGYPEIQLYNLEVDEGEKNNIYKKYPGIVKELTAELQKIVDDGRSTTGRPQKNDVAIDIYKSDK